MLIAELRKSTISNRQSRAIIVAISFPPETWKNHLFLMPLPRASFPGHRSTSSPSKGGLSFTRFHDLELLHASPYRGLGSHSRQRNQDHWILGPLKLREAIHWIAKLGGFIGPQRDGDPGHITLWRGLPPLNDITRCWQLVANPSTKD